jgi:hypothetical protein
MDLHSLQEKLLTFNSYFMNTLLFLTIIGIGFTKPSYILIFEYYLKIYIGFFLIYRFNRFRKIEFNELDRKVAFTSGILLLSSILSNQLTKYTTQLKEMLSIF